ncbi:MAG: DUF975 family protein [Clostridia bacterium]|nr:DUF975 family protein [Clostridia bacterium]
MKYPFWVLKQDGLRLLKGKWNPFVLSLFIPFLIYCAIFVRMFMAGGDVETLNLTAGMMLQSEVVTLVFLFIWEFVTLGIYHQLQPDKDKTGFFGVYSFGFRYFWKLLPTVCLTLLFPTGLNLLLTYGNVDWLYDYLFFSLMPYEVYYLLLAVLSLIVQILGLYLKYALVFAPCILAEHPEYGPFLVIKESFRLSRSNKLYVFLLEFSFLGWMVLGSMAVIGVLWASIYMLSARFAFYKRLTEPQEFFVELNPMQ